MYLLAAMLLINTTRGIITYLSVILVVFLTDTVTVIFSAEPIPAAKTMMGNTMFSSVFKVEGITTQAMATPFWAKKVGTTIPMATTICLPATKADTVTAPGFKTYFWASLVDILTTMALETRS